jgi:hypothetical protein
VIIATYLPAGSGSKSEVGSIWFASNPVRFAMVFPRFADEDEKG